MIVTTTSTVDDQAIAAYLGPVSVARLIDARRSPFGAEDAAQRIWPELAKRAGALGGDAVVGAGLTVASLGNGDVLITGTGTAVRLVPSTARSAPRELVAPAELRLDAAASAPPPLTRQATPEPKKVEPAPPPQRAEPRPVLLDPPARPRPALQAVPAGAAAVRIASAKAATVSGDRPAPAPLSAARAVPRGNGQTRPQPAFAANGAMPAIAVNPARGRA